MRPQVNRIVGRRITCLGKRETEMREVLPRDLLRWKYVGVSSAVVSGYNVIGPIFRGWCGA